MDVYVYDSADRRQGLPPLYTWRVSLGCGEACDAFDITCAYDSSQDALLPHVARLEAFHEGKQVFCGAPDEWTVSLGSRGRVTRLAGRGPQAVLLDNEAAPAHFIRVGWADIAARYVTPAGIKTQPAALPAATDFQVESGMSVWRVVSLFAGDHGGAYPRFLADGTLTVRPFDTAKPAELNVSAAALSAACRLDRFGAVTGVLVRNRDTRGNYLLENAAYAGPGGRRLVMTGVGREGVALMERTARLRMRRSLRGVQTAKVTLPGVFTHAPGDAVALNHVPKPFAGVYIVWSAENRCDESSGATTALTLVLAKYL